MNSGWNFPGGPVAKTHASSTEGLDSICGQGTGPHMPQLKVPHAATETHSSQTNK